VLGDCLVSFGYAAIPLSNLDPSARVGPAGFPRVRNVLVKVLADAGKSASLAVLPPVVRRADEWAHRAMYDVC
jgi:hypothetical protein